MADNTGLQDNANVHDWFDFWTDPGTVAMIAFGALLIPFGFLFATEKVATLATGMYTVYAGSVVAILGGHCVTDWGKTREMMKRRNGDNNNQGDPDAKPPVQ